MRKACIVGGLITFALVQAAASEVYDASNLPIEAHLRDLVFPAAPQSFGKAKASRLFKPDGSGPFPGLVVLPTCGGHDGSYHTYDWAGAALSRGYAVLVVDPLTPRGAGSENCRPPIKVGLARVRKDGFDAAEHLRKQPFVDRERVGLIGLSWGAMAGLGAAGEGHATPGDRSSFRAIVSIYPICYQANFRSALLKRVVDFRFVPFKVVVPLQVQMGELDTEAPAKDCVRLLDELKKGGAPVDFFVHRNATHAWDRAELGTGTFRKKGLAGQDIVYRYNSQVTAESVKLAFEFLDRHLKGK